MEEVDAGPLVVESGLEDFFELVHPERGIGVSCQQARMLPRTARVSAARAMARGQVDRQRHLGQQAHRAAIAFACASELVDEAFVRLAVVSGADAHEFFEDQTRLADRAAVGRFGYWSAQRTERLQLWHTRAAHQVGQGAANGWR